MSAKTKVAVVDFGTSKIVTLVAENSSAERCKLIGIGVANYAGYVQEGWNDPEHLDEQIESSIRDAEKTMRGADVTELYVGVPAMFTQVYASETTITLKGADPRVTQQDVMNAVSEAEAKVKSRLPQNMGYIVHSSPAWYSLDSDHKTLDVIGKKGRELTVLISVVVADRGFVDEVNHRLSAMDYHVQGFYSSAVGEALLFIPAEERDRTAVLIDVGYLTTDVMIAEGDALIYLRTIDLGGASLAADLATTLDIDMTDAEEKIKRKYTFGIDTGETYSVGQPAKTFTRAEVSAVIEPFVTELAEEVNRVVAESGVSLGKTSVFFMTGGGLGADRGGRDFFSGKIGRPLRETPKHTSSLNNHIYASSLGVLDLIVEKLSTERQQAAGGRMRQFFYQLFHG